MVHDRALIRRRACVVAVAWVCASCAGRAGRTPPQRVNLALPALGGKLESVGTGSPGLREMVFSFYKQREALVDAVVVNASSPAILADPRRMPKDVSVLVSSTTATEGFSRIATATLQQVIGEQTISFSPVKAKYVKVRILSTYGGSVADVRDVKISEAPGDRSIVADISLDVAAAELGGQIERLSGEYGSGYDGRRLIDGRQDTIWRAKTSAYPQEIVLSFFNRQPALVSSIDIVSSANAAAAPREVEVSASMQGPGEGFTQVAAMTLPSSVNTQTISFAPVEARFIRVVIRSAAQAGPVEIADIRVPQASRAGYLPLERRNSEMLSWDRRPTQAAQWGVDWLQPAAIEWQTHNQCFGCHNQAQVIMGLSVAKKNKYLVSDPALNELVTFVHSHDDQRVTSRQFASMALANWSELSGAPDPEFGRLTATLIQSQQPSGQIPGDHTEPPIDQGDLMTTANSVVAFMRLFRTTGQAAAKAAADRAMGWIAAAQPETTQDKVFKLLALSWFGTAAQQKEAEKLVAVLKSEQNADGGWREAKETKGSNAFATGQVLYAFKQAHVDIASDAFVRGVRFLLATQKDNGAWPSFNSQSSRPSDFAPTMWAVIGLAGSFREKTGSLQVVTAEGPAKPAIGKNIEIVLDLSGSMNSPLGTSTRIAVAREVLRGVLQRLPADSQVGLRLYGHRFPSLSKQTCTDTELVLPIQRLDAAGVLAAVERYEPRGDTALVYSVLQTPGDLQKVGGGSVILITDGQEDCHGDPTAASRTLKESGIDITLHIVGFTVKGKAVEDQLRALAEASGGRFYTADDGDALARALQDAAVRYPYTIVDAAGRNVAVGQADGSPADLPPGDYRLIVYTAGRQIANASVTIGAGKDLKLTLVARDGTFVLQNR